MRGLGIFLDAYLKALELIEGQPHGGYMIKKAKIVLVAASFWLAFSGSVFAEPQLSQCDPVRYPMWVYYYPQTSQEGQPLVPSEQSLQNEANINREDLMGGAVMKANLAQMMADTKGQPLQSLAVFRNSEGKGCFESVPVNQPAYLTSTSSASSAEPQADTEVTEETPRGQISRIGKIVGILLNYGPMALSFVNPIAGLAAGVAAPFLAPKVMSQFASDRAKSSEPSEEPEKKLKFPKTKQHYDHDESGSFAHLWNN